ncbi:hypothetical protein OH492_11130 [Vibrio chagasii]|nr:hypothetical protein [Vibrio chagasii]
MSGLRKVCFSCSFIHFKKMVKHWLIMKPVMFLKPNMDVGFYQPVDANEFINTCNLSTTVVGIGTHNFERVWKMTVLKRTFH